MDVELRLLRSFVAVAEELNFTRAAKRRFIAQQALSSHIQHLEAAVGVQLLARSTRRVELTPAGRAFLTDVRRILTSLDASIDRVRRVGEGRAGSVRIAYTVTAAYDVLPVLETEIRQVLPDVEVVTRETFSGQIAEMLLGGACDLAVAQEPAAMPGIAMECVRREPLVVMVAKDHPLAGEDAVAMADLADQRLGLWPRDVGPGFYDRVVGYWSGAGLPLDIDTSASGSALWSSVAAGRLITFTVASVHGQEHRGTRVVPLKDDCSIGMYLMWLEESPSPTTTAVVHIARAVSDDRDWLIEAS